MSHESHKVSTDDLVPIVQPAMQVLLNMAEAAVVLVASALPDAASRAMAELADQSKLALDDSPEPVHAAHSLAGMIRFASTDFVRQFAHLFSSQPVPVYAHLPVARSALESAATSSWLIEFPIGAKRRVQRFLVLRSLSAHEMRRGPVAEFRSTGEEVIRRLEAQCDRLGWTHSLSDSRRLSIDEESLPAKADLIQALFRRGRTAEETGRIGRTSWWYMSGVQHGVLYALIESIQWNEPDVDALAPTVASMYTSSQSVIQYAAVVGLAFDALIESHSRLFGWTHSDWDAARQAFIALLRSVTGSPTAVNGGRAE